MFTVDINPRNKPDLVDDAQYLRKIIEDDAFSRWRCDPPYNVRTASDMYNTDLPETSKLLAAGSQVLREGSLMFLLLGPQNYQMCPKGVKRIGWVPISVIPNNEVRALHIFYKEKKDDLNEEKDQTKVSWKKEISSVIRGLNAIG